MERVIEELLSRLPNQGLDIRPLYYAEDRASARIAAQPSIYLPLPRTRNRLPTLRSSVNVIRSLGTLAGLLARIWPDVVNCHYADYTAAYFAVLKPFFKYRLIISAHGSDLMEPSSLDQVLLPYVLRASDHMIGVSDALCERARFITGRAVQSTTIHNGIDYDFWAGGSVKRSTSPVIVSVGSLRRVKGHDVLLRAFARVRSADATARLVLIGDGPERERLEALSHELGIAQSVIFKGWLEPHHVREHLNRASVFAFPSRHEGLGLALLEAMAAGVPCVASCVGGIPEVITDGHDGFLVEKKNPAALASRLIQMLKELPDFLVGRARERAKSFDWELTVDRYRRVLCAVS